MTAFMALENIQIGRDAKEVTTWFRLHHCEPLLYEGRCYAVNIPLVCQWLEYDDQQKKYRCRDYEHRPVVCREFLCKRLRDIIVKDLVQQHGICL